MRGMTLEFTNGWTASLFPVADNLTSVACWPNKEAPARVMSGAATGEEVLSLLDSIKKMPPIAK